MDYLSKVRGFEEVSSDHKKNHEVFTNESGKKHSFPKEITLPKRADKGSSGYDFYIPTEVMILPHQSEIIWTDVKAYMQDDEELLLFIRSSLAIKKGLTLTNSVGKIDSSYYNNEDNDGNIGIAVKNTTGQAIKLEAGERIAQGTFYKYLTADSDEVLSDERTGGIGSSGL